ncbi:MAG: PAS domain S-box protein [bacterium]|nr:PAS domain S-box protein [bacterium]
MKAQFGGSPPAARGHAIKRCLYPDEEISREAVRGFMHMLALVPFVTVLVSAAFGAVSVVWDSERRPTRSMGAIFLWTGVWALLDLLSHMESEAARALMWMRWMQLPLLMIGPSALWVVAHLLPRSIERLSRHARVGALVCFTLGVGAALSPGSIEGVVPMDLGGWMPRYGIVSIILMPVGVALPVYAAIEATRIQGFGSPDRNDPRRVWAFRVSLGFSLFVALPTEYALPLMEISAPRLGALVVSLTSTLMWMRVVHESDDLVVTPHGVARALLAELRDGVALVSVDGVILSTNIRFAEMSGRTGADLLGESLQSLIGASAEKILADVEDGESTLYRSDGVSVPVSLSTSIVHNRTGGVIGVVVVFHDLREVDVLRSQLLTSGRLAAIGELAAGIAHEVNNPVAYIRSDLNLLSERIGEMRGWAAREGAPEGEVPVLARGQRRIEKALEGIERVAEIVRDVREFAHVGGAGQGGSDPAAVVEGAMRLARLQRGEEVELRIASVSCCDRVDAGQELKQILLTLMRVLVSGAEKGSRLDADLRSEAQDLVIALSVDPLIGSSTEMLARFDVLGAHLLEGPQEDFGLKVAAELIDQLGGGLRIEEIAPKALRLEVSVPFVLEGTSP